MAAGITAESAGFVMVDCNGGGTELGALTEFLKETSMQACACAKKSKDSQKLSF